MSQQEIQSSGSSGKSVAPASPRPKPRPKPAASPASDGQVVVIAARWILVVTGLFLVLWNPVPLVELRFQVAVLLMLAVGNFFVHAQLLMRRPMSPWIMIAASAFDIGVITLLVITQSGFDSNTYIFYFPALLAISVAFETIVTLLFTSSVIGLYSLIAFSSYFDNYNTGADVLQVLVVRLLMFTAVAFCGTLYWRIEVNRQQEASRAQQELMAELRQRQETSQVVNS